ncbi:MAG: extracellular solute-binding protein [Clostridia bacterium]|nr:extracellular solute-binding protein [Clostridia bacterium]
MKMGKGKLAKKFLAACLGLVFVVSSFSLGAMGDSGQTLKEKFSDNLAEAGTVASTDRYYFYVKQEYDANGYKSVEDANIVIDVMAPTQQVAAGEVFSLSGVSQDTARVDTGLDFMGEGTLLWPDDVESYSWSVNVPEEGLYEIQIEYLPLDGKGTTIQRSVAIDGVVPYTEAYNIPFVRQWEDYGEIRYDNMGDEIRQKKREVRQWSTISVCDNDGYYSEPMLFYFTAGSHTITMGYVDEPMAIRSMALVSPKKYKSYAEVAQEYSEKGYKAAEAEVIKFQAEETLRKSDQILHRTYDSDPLCEPDPKNAELLNTIGGSNWRYGNQEITWQFEVPQDGLYQIGMRVGQWWNDGLPSYRMIKIDGEVPFEELLNYGFDYVQDWQFVTLGESESDGAYLFYLTEGEHTINMRAVMGPLTSIAQEVMTCTLKISEIYRKIIMITGTNPDVNYEYDLDKTIPNILEDFTYLADKLEELSGILTGISVKKPSMANNFDTIIVQLRDMVKRPDTIARKIDEIYNAQTSLGNYITTLKTQYLQLDYFTVSPPETPEPRHTAGFFKKAEYTWINFLRSFTKDYDTVGNVYDPDANKTIDLWVSRGTDWAEIIKQLADDEFTPESGIQVNMNIMPSGQLSAGAVNALMLAINSGRAPDVASGVDATSPVEYAIRGAAADLSMFEGYDEVVARFYPTIMTPYTYRGGVYALPEQMDFQVLIYRKDILAEHGIRIPDTWQDLYEKVLPVLNQNGLEFMPSGFPLFLYQNGGAYYNADGTMSGLDTPEAYTAFKEWTEQYTSYGMPIEANFFNRFRNGEMPMGIIGYADYIKVTTAAPELFGRWDISVVPGHVMESGEVDRSVGTLAGASIMILEDSDMKEESWEFVKWWTSASVQEEFGREVEAMLGVEARWNSANVEAFENSSWDADHKDVILRQLMWAKEQPVVLGGYYTSRHITNAWTRVVTGNTIPRDSLEQAVKDINKELRNKQEEYGAVSDEGDE